MSDLNVCREAFDRLCADVNTNLKPEISEADYWLFELGFRSAIEELLTIADSGEQSRQFVSPRFQMLADCILRARPH